MSCKLLVFSQHLLIFDYHFLCTRKCSDNDMYFIQILFWSKNETFCFFCSKPKINPQLVAQQVAQQYAGPLTPPPGSPNPDDEDHDRLFPDPEDDLFGPPPAPPKPVFKKDKSLAVVNKGEKSNTQITKQNTQQKQHKQARKNTRYIFNNN